MRRIMKKINGLGYIGQHREITAALPNQIPNLRVSGSNPLGVTNNIIDFGCEDFSR